MTEQSGHKTKTAINQDAISSLETLLHIANRKCEPGSAAISHLNSLEINLRFDADRGVNLETLRKMAAIASDAVV